MPGSTIGPDGALYVTDGSAGKVRRIDRRSGRVTTYAKGLPKKAFATDIGGPVDIVFVGRTACVLVTLVSGEIVGVPGAGPFGDANDKNGIYRIERDGGNTLIADIGSWSVDNPQKRVSSSTLAWQYAMERYHGGFLVTDGPQPVIGVKKDGSIKEVATFGNVGRPAGSNQTPRLHHPARPIPHEPEDGKVLARIENRTPPRSPAGRACYRRRAGTARQALRTVTGSMGHVGEGSPVSEHGRLLIVKRDGSLKRSLTAAERSWYSIGLTSMEFVRDTHTSFPWPATSTDRQPQRRTVLRQSAGQRASGLTGQRCTGEEHSDVGRWPSGLRLSCELAPVTRSGKDTHQARARQRRPCQPAS